MENNNGYSKEEVAALREVLEKFKDKTDIGLAFALIDAGFGRVNV